MSGRRASAVSAPFAFLDGALDRADHLRDDVVALDALWQRAVVLRLDADGRADDAGHGAPVTNSGHRGPRPDDAVFLGLADGTPWFALRGDPRDATDVGSGSTVVGAEASIAGGIDLRTAAAHWPVAAATAFAQARAVLHWQARHRHCGACGATVGFRRGGWQGRCTQCGLDHYPRTDPAIIVAVTDGHRLLLGRQANWPPRRYSTLAGFVEPGESLEHTVAREVFEESGVRVRSSRYLASQPWPFPSSLMLGFIADAEPDAPVVNHELEDARWFGIDEVGAALRRDGDGRHRDASVDAGADDVGAPDADADDPDDSSLLLPPRLSISRWLIEQWHALQSQR